MLQTKFCGSFHLKFGHLSADGQLYRSLQTNPQVLALRISIPILDGLTVRVNTINKGEGSSMGHLQILWKFRDISLRALLIRLSSTHSAKLTLLSILSGWMYLLMTPHFLNWTSVSAAGLGSGGDMCRSEHNGASSRAWVTRGPLLQLRDTGACGGGEHIRHHNWRAEPRGAPLTPLERW